MTKGSPNKPRKVAVIGAGAAGICAAKYLLQAGLDVEAFEIGTQIGGLWVYENDNGRSSAYKSLHINSEKRNTQFLEFPFPKDIQFFPDHRDMAKYLKDYADRFGVTQKINFSSEVERVLPSMSAAGELAWRLEVKGGRSYEFDSVVIATGHLTVPVDPALVSEFEGRYLHSHYYREPAEFAGQRVLVIGSGNSGCDITADICPIAERTVMCARSPELIVPKLFLGVPVTQITGMFERPWVPKGTGQLARRLITRIVHGRMEDWGLVTPKGLTHPTSHPTLINLLAYRKAFVKPGIQSIKGKTVTFVDGTAEEFDTIIGATGYEIDYPFVSETMLPLEDGRADLYKRVVPVEWPGIYYIGLFNTLGSSNLRMFEVQSRWVAAIEAGKAFLPSKQEMYADIKRRNEEIARKFPAGRRHAIEIEPIPYTKELAVDTDTGLRRRQAIEKQFNGIPADLEYSRAVEVRIPPIEAAIA